MRGKIFLSVGLSPSLQLIVSNPPLSPSINQKSHLFDETTVSIFRTFINKNSKTYILLLITSKFSLQFLMNVFSLPINSAGDTVQVAAPANTCVVNQKIKMIHHVIYSRAKIEFHFEFQARTLVAGETISRLSPQRFFALLPAQRKESQLVGNNGMNQLAYPTLGPLLASVPEMHLVCPLSRKTAFFVKRKFIVVSARVKDSFICSSFQFINSVQSQLFDVSPPLNTQRTFNKIISKNVSNRNEIVIKICLDYVTSSTTVDDF